MEEIRARFTIDEATMKPGISIGFWIALKMQILWFGIGFALISLGFFLLQGMGSLLGYGFALFGTAFLLYFHPYSVSTALNNIKKSPAYNQVNEWTFTEDRAISRLPNSEGATAYPAFLKTTTTPEGFLLYYQPQLFQWIPKSGFENPDGYEKLAAILAENTKNKVLK